MNKINYDIVLVNSDTADKLLMTGKKLLQEEKMEQKDINSKKDLLQKVLLKKEKFKKAIEEEQMLQIFMMDSIDITMDQKIRKKNKIKEIEK